MKRRLLASFLWFYCVWTGWGLLALATPIDAALGPIVGLLAAGLFLGLTRRTSAIGARQAVSAPAA